MSMLSSTVNDEDEDENCDKENKRSWKPFLSPSQEVLCGGTLQIPQDAPKTSPGGRPCLRDIEPLLAASPNIMHKTPSSGGRGRGPKPGAHPLGALYIAYTPPHPKYRSQGSAGSSTPNSDAGSSASGKSGSDKIRAFATPTIPEEGEGQTVETAGEVSCGGGSGRRLGSSSQKRRSVNASTSNLDVSQACYMSPVPGGRASYRLTPSTPRTNPFDIYDPSELTMSIVSPSVFCISKERSNANGCASGSTRDPSSATGEGQGDSSAQEGTKPFRWSIDQLAVLYPADIDITDKEVSRQEIHKTPDIEYERQVEAAIDEYFSQNLIVPSPWVGHSGARHQSRLAELMEHNASPVVGGAGNRATAGTSPFDNDPPPRPENNESAGSAMNMTNLRSNKSANTSTTQVHVREVACQTRLTIPMDVDLEKLLGAYHSNHEDVVVTHSNDSSFTSRNTSLAPGDAGPIGADILSTSTLRRKLFSQIDDDEGDACEGFSEPSTTTSPPLLKKSSSWHRRNKQRQSANVVLQPVFDDVEQPDPGAGGPFGPFDLDQGAFSLLDTTPPTVPSQNDEETPASLQYISSSPIRGSGTNPHRPHGASPILCMFVKPSQSKADSSLLPDSLNASSVHGMELGSAVKGRGTAASGASPASPSCSPVPHRSSSPAARSPRGPRGAPGALSSPPLRSPIPFILSTPPLCPPSSNLSGSKKQPSSKDRFPSPDVSPIKDQGSEAKFCEPNSHTEEIIGNLLSTSHHSNQCLSLNPIDEYDSEGDVTPQSLAFGLKFSDDKGLKQDQSQLGCGMDVDTPLKPKFMLQGGMTDGSMLETSQLLSNQTSDQESMMEVSHSEYSSFHPKATGNVRQLVVIPACSSETEVLPSTTTEASFSSSSIVGSSYPSFFSQSVMRPASHWNPNFPSFDVENVTNFQTFKFDDPLCLSTPLPECSQPTACISTHPVGHPDLKDLSVGVNLDQKSIDFQPKTNDKKTPTMDSNPSMGQYSNIQTPYMAAKMLHFSSIDTEHSGVGLDSQEEPSNGSIAVREESTTHQLSWVAPLVASTPTRRQHNNKDD